MKKRYSKNSHYLHCSWEALPLSMYRNQGWYRMGAAHARFWMVAWWLKSLQPPIILDDWGHSSAFKGQHGTRSGGYTLVSAGGFESCEQSRVMFPIGMKSLVIIAGFLAVVSLLLRTPAGQPGIHAELQQRFINLPGNAFHLT